MHVKTSSKYLLMGALSGLLAVGSPASALAQQQGADIGAADPTDEQLELNADAVGAIQSGEYAKAVELLKKSNEIAPMNVTWLNLGRAYQKLGKCGKARQAYLNVISAPAVKDPSPRLINAKADQYLGQLDEQCEQTEDDRQMANATGKAKDDEAETQTKSTEEQAVKTPAAEPTEPTASESSDVLGWTLAASGLVVAGAGVGTHFWAESIRDDVTTRVDGANGGVVDMTRQEALDKESKANTLDTVALSAIIAGGVVSAGGAYLLLSSDDVEAQPSASVGPDGTMSLGLSGSF